MRLGHVVGCRPRSGFDLPTQSRFLSFTGFKASTEVYAIVEGPSFCINAFVDLPSIKFCGELLGVPIPCGFAWNRISVEIVVRPTFQNHLPLRRTP